MRDILVDITKIKDMHSGLGQFSMSFAHELTRQLPEDLTAHFLVSSKINNLVVDNRNVSLVKTSFQKRYLPFLNREYFIWHSLHQFPSFSPKKNAIRVLTIHDLNFLIEKKKKRKKNRDLRRLQKNVDRADYVTAISNYTKEQIENNINLKGKKIRVIYNGVSSGIAVKKIKPPFVKGGKYFFSIGTVNKKKNFKSLIPLMKHFEEYQLILAGNKDFSYCINLQREINKLGLGERVVLPGRISESHKQWLYANCEAFLFPSLAEGFGMPPIEAMKSGKPIFLSKHTALPEIGGEMAFYFDNFEASHMSSVIKTKLDYVCQNEEKFIAESKKYAEKFNWKNCMTEYVSLYREIENDYNTNYNKSKKQFP